MREHSKLRVGLNSRKALIGLLQTHANLAFAEIAGIVGYDFIILDDEHGVFSQDEFLQTLRALSFCEIAVFIRLRGHDVQAVGRYLDMGADGIVAPNVTTVEEAIALVRAMEYPPNGTRGMGAAAHRATRYGVDLAAHVKAPRAGVSLLVLIESALGLENSEEILSVEGVDGAIIGPSDLAANLGLPGDFSNPAFAAAMVCVEQAALKCEKVVGTAVNSSYPLDALINRGHRLLIVGTDTRLIRDAMFAQVSNAKSYL